MSDTERVIGALTEFKKGATREFLELKREIRDLKREVRALSHFKWKAAGALAMLMAAIEVVRIWLEIKP